MNDLFVARNKLKEYSFQRFAEYLQKNKSNLTSIDYINLIQQSFNLYRKEFIDYVRLFHKYFHDIVFSQVPSAKNKDKKYAILEEFLKHRKAWELEELVKIDQRIIKNFDLYGINCTIDNAYDYKDSKNGYEMLQIIIQKRPDIIIDPVEDNQDNPLLQAIRKQLYDIAGLLVKSHCYILPHRNYFSNQFHYLFKNRTTKKNQIKILQLSKLLINNKVDLYQKNQQGKTAIQLCPNQIRQQIQKMHKASLPAKNYRNTQTGIQNLQSNSGNNKQDEKYSKNNRNNNNSKNNKYEADNDRYDSNNDGKNSSKQQRAHNNSSGSSNMNTSSTKNLYKGKVKSQFGGKDIIKENNELLRINIQSNNLTHKDNTTNIPDSNVVRILNFQQLQNQAGKIFQRHTQKKQGQYLNQKAQFEKQQKAAKQKRTKVIPSEQLKYYLKEEIIYLTQKIKAENLKQKQIFMKLYEDIKQLLQKNISQIEVELFGSFATGLNIEHSDIDIVISKKSRQINKVQTVTPGQILNILARVNYQLLEMKQYFQQTKFLDKASVPIIKATCNLKYKCKQVDISFMDEQHNGIKSVSLNKQYLEMYPELNNLLLVLKKLIYSSNVFGPYSGGLSSYGLFLMILAYLQNQQGKQLNSPQQKKKIDTDLRVAQLLIGFLKFYGFTMDYVTQLIVVAHPDQINQMIAQNNVLKGTTYNSQWQSEYPIQPKLIIIDPLDQNNNVGKSTRRIKQIKMAFELAFIAIHTNKRCNHKKTCESYKRIKATRVQQVRYRQNKRPCCILERMFNSTKSFDLNLY